MLGVEIFISVLLGVRGGRLGCYPELSRLMARVISNFEPECSLSVAAEPPARCQAGNSPWWGYMELERIRWAPDRQRLSAVCWMEGSMVPRIFCDVLTTLSRDFESEALQLRDQMEMQLVNRFSMVPLYRRWGGWEGRGRLSLAVAGSAGVVCPLTGELV